MANPGRPTLQLNDTGDAVRRLQRALRRTPDLGVVVDGIVGPLTWAALPDGGPMPLLQEAATGPVVASLQTVLTNGASNWGGVTPQGVDGDFGPHTRAAVEAFQGWGGVAVDGIVGDQTWSVSLHAMSATLETAVGLQYVMD